MGRKNYGLVVGILLALSGCQSPNPHVSETEEVPFQQGQQFLSENRPEEAFKSFYNLLEKRNGEGPRTHFELGQLFLNIKNDPISSIYHLRQYLIQDPNSPKTRMVLQMIETAKKEFARTLPFDDHYNESPEYLNLLEVVKQLRSENTQLKRKLAQAKAHAIPKKTLPTTSAVVQRIEPSNTSSERTYLVESDDTLSKISLKMYGSAVKWKIIFDANQDVLNSPKNLKAGMSLRIPALKK